MSQSFSSTYSPEDVLILGDAEAVIGTAMLGDDFGKIKSFSVKRTGDEEELSNGAGSLRGHVIKKPGVEATMEVFFDATVTAPRLYQIIMLPIIGIAARVMPGVDIKYDDGKERGMSIPIKMWDALIGKPAFRLDTATGNRFLLDIGIPVPTATPGTGTIVLDWPDVEDATTYEIQVSSDAGVTWAHLTTPSVSNYTHTVTTGQTRHYRIAAKNADGQGEWSSTVNATAA
ncbi:hypothetical protein [Prosthecobacter sp.]|uniref:hypothetical protein n=1 Tax=Prosthecobacter sp. TaxID=1965333 RepID=UPI00378468E4